ncbi:DoxX family protein [Longimicrobium sp.]|uniref:DoxX family protein n=1 Tax=Longimicrobium sp. TaxID=2029185 RepID=UPI002E32AABA|nr:DoxX family protein [Longimicrobium sp.]HEX6039453.1 DoxX family protein [Longimicrobium sp.]
MRIPRGTSRIVLAALFAFAGTMHFIIPDQYVRIMPPWLPLHRELVYLSGLCEIAGGLGLLVPRTRRAAGIGLILLLIAVWPANLQMLLNARASGASTWAQTALLLRLPLQLLLMLWAWRASRTESTDPALQPSD